MFVKTQSKLQNNILSPRLISLHPSTYHLLIILAVCFCAFVSVVISGVGLCVKLSLIAGLSSYIIYLLYYWSKLGLTEINKLEGRWYISYDRFEQSKWHISDCYYWSLWVIILRVENDYNKPKLIPIFADSCHHRDFHRLRLISRFDINDYE